jgi:hypothetical protein
MQDDDYDDYIPDPSPEAVEDAPAQAEAPEARDYEADARKQGWKPKDEFDGPADKWRPADEFVKRGNEDPRILRTRVDKLDKLYSGVKAQWQADLSAKEKEFNERVERLNRVSELALKRQRDTYEAQIATAKRQAVQEGDAERYDQLEQHERAVQAEWRKEDEAVAEQPKPKSDPREAAPKLLPETETWVSKNASWFNKDRTLTDEAIAYENYLAQSQPGLSVAERLEKTREHVVTTFPNKFGRKNGMSQDNRKGSPVEGSQRGPGGSANADGGFGQLPSEARTQFKAFVKEGIFKDSDADRASYAKYYSNPNADKVI